jgi:hypothetical protein
MFFIDGLVPFCNNCIDKELRAHEWDWAYVDKMCQMADIPFIPKEWERLREMSDQEVFYRYAQVF